MGSNSIGRRLEKRRMASTFRFVWDGNALLHETFKKDNSENTELTTWVFEGFVPTAKLVNGKAYSIISDLLGTPILAVDSEGNEVWNRQLDIYGRVKREIKASLLGDDVHPFIPFLYQGQYYDFETNLAYNRFRYYSPETGAYISQDPIGLEGNNPNIYAYVEDSNCWVDIFGLACIKNKQEGLRREDTLRRILEEIHGKDRVLTERTLLDANGNKVTHRGTGRRIDFIILDDKGNAIKSYEVTSKTSNKVPQITKENGGTFVKDKNGNLVDISNVPTQIIRIR